MADEESKTYEVSLTGPGQVLMGGGAGILTALIVESAVGDGPTSRRTSRVQQGQDSSNRELFRYDTGVEAIGSFALGAALLVTTVKLRNRRRSSRPQ